MRRFYLALVFLGLLVAAGCSTQNGVVNEVVGSWVHSSDVMGLSQEVRLDLDDDGTGTMTIVLLGEELYSDLTWRVENNKLCFTFSDGTPEECAEYTIDGDRMTSSLMGETRLYERRSDN